MPRPLQQQQQRFGGRRLFRCAGYLLYFSSTWTAASGTGRFASITSGLFHTCALTLEDPSSGTLAGTAYCWGNNDRGQLGDGTLVGRVTPTWVNTTLSFANLAVGKFHTCGLTASGAAYCWGRNDCGQLGDNMTTDRPTPVAVSTNLVASILGGSLVAGELHTCGLAISGAAYCWGSNVAGQLGDNTTTNRWTPVAVSTSLVAYFLGGSLAAGLAHTCGLSASGAAYCWGWNGIGQLGDNTTTNRWTPVAVSTSLVASFLVGSLVAGQFHTCGLAASGAAYCWGWNGIGQLGDNTTTNRWTPVAVSTSLVAYFLGGSLAAGLAHTCGLSASGTAYCWGNNGNGQLGDNTTTNRWTPVTVSTKLVSSFVNGSLVAGEAHTCGLAASGAVYCWGNNDIGQLGDNTTTQRLTPVAVVSAKSTTASASGLFANIASGSSVFHTCGLTLADPSSGTLQVAGTAYCWGWNTKGQLGDGTLVDRTTPTLVNTTLLFASLTLGGAHTCGLTASGAAYCWGRNVEGQLGDNTNTMSTTPVVVSTSLVASFLVGSLVAGQFHTCGLAASGAAYCWGRNDKGQLGDNTNTWSMTPVAVNPSLTASFLGGSLAAGVLHTCGLAASGTAYCWGWNGYGQLGDNATTDRLTPFAVSTSLVASCLGGSLVAGEYHTCCLAASGVAYCWGFNAYGQLGDNTTTDRWTPVAVCGSPVTSFAGGSLAAGSTHTCGLAASGAAYCWGSNGWGQLGDNANTMSATPVAVSTSLVSSFQDGSLAAGNQHTCGLATSGAVYCWGYNARGSLGDNTTTNVNTPVAVVLVLASNSPTSSTATLSPSPSQMPSATMSLSPSPSETLSQTSTSSPSPTASQTHTPRASQTPSQASTQSPTQSSSATGTGSVSTTATLTVSPSQTATQTCTPSTSRQPYALLFSSASSVSSESGDAGSLAVSDSLVAAPFTLALSRCPTDGGGVLAATVACAVSPAGPLAPLNLSAPSPRNVALFQAMSSPPSVPVSVGPVSCNPSSDAFVPLGLINAVGAYFGTGSGDGMLVCRVTSSSQASAGSTLAIGTQPVSVTATLWPLWVDAILVTDFGILRSPRLGLSLNGTQQLLRLSGCGDVATAVRNLTAVVAAAQSAFATTALPPADSSRGFSMTLTGATTLVLRAAQTQGHSQSQQAHAAFRAGTSATLGLGTCAGIAVSDDGRWMALRTPPANATCRVAASASVSSASSSTSCGYVTITVNTSAAEGSGSGPGSHPLGVALPCPPFCPGDLGLSSDSSSSGSGSGATVPIPQPDGTYGFAINPTAIGSATPPSSLSSWAQSASASSSSAGIFYTLACAQSGLYTDPTTGACSNASDPSSDNCAYGAGDECQLCPSSALCPGGFRMWSRAGFWAALDTTDVMSPCSTPNAEARCTGWNVALGSTSCGAGYLQGSHLCGACVPGYFLEDDGTCTACPVLKSAWDRYRTLLYILIVLAVIVALVWVGLLMLVRLRGGTLVGGAARMFGLFVWGLLSAQVVSNAATVSSPTLPPLLASLYRAAAVLQLRGVLLPPACTGAYPFESQVSLMGLALGAWILCVAVFYARRALTLDCRLYKAATLLGRAALTLALVLYSSCSSSAVSLLNCSSVSVAARSAAALDGASAAPATATASAAAEREATATLRILVGNPYFVCWAGSHRPAGVLAAVTLVLYVAALPAVLLVWAWADPWLRMQLRAWARAEAAKPADKDMDKADQTSGQFLDNPLRFSRHGQQTQSSPAPSLHDAPDADPLLLPILGDYLPSAWYTKLVDVLLLLALSLLRALVPQPATLSLIVAKAAVSCTFLLAVCAHVALVQTFVPQQAWKSWVRALLLFDSAGCALLNAAVSAQDVGLGGPRLAASAVVGSYLLFVLCCITLIVLLWQFGASMYAGAEAEQRDLVVAATARSAALPVPRSAPLVHAADGDAGAQMQPLSLVSSPQLLSDYAEHAQATRMVVNPMQPRTRSGRGKSRSHLRSRSLARLSLTLRGSGGDPEAALAACVALRDEFHLALGPTHMSSVSFSMSVSTSVSMSVSVDMRASSSAVGALSDALVQHGANAAVVRAACEGLRAATVCSPAAVPALISAGAPRDLLEVLRTHGAAPSAQSEAISHASCGALAAIAASTAGATALVDAGGVDCLTSLLHASLAGRRCTDGGVGVGEATSEACRVLAELSAHEDAVQRLADSSGVIEALVSVLAAAAAAAAATALVSPGSPPSESLSNVTAASYAAKTVAAVTLADDALARFMATGGVAPLISLLQAWLHLTPTRSSRPPADAASESASAVRLQVSAAAMATHVSEAMLSLSTRAHGAAALFDAGAMPVMLEAISVASSAGAADSGNEPRNWALCEAVCWTLRGFSRDRRQLGALVAPDAAARVAALLAVCEATIAAPASGAETEAVCRVAEHARALLGALAQAAA